MAGLYDDQASIYAVARPSYPSALFDLLASLTSKHERAWDVGTGNGQAAVGVAKHYDQVIATDVSEQQLKYAAKRPNITYAVTSPVLSREEVTEIVGGEGSVDLVTVAEAVHWFDLDSFYGHVKHVLRKPGGVIAVWCYRLVELKINAQVDEFLKDFYNRSRAFRDPLPNFTMVGGYESLHFPFEAAMEEGGTGPITMDATINLTVERLLGILRSTFVVNVARRRGVDLLDEHVVQALKNAWGSPVDEVKTINFPVHLRIGRPPS